MSQQIYQTANQKDLFLRQVPLDTLVTPDNCQILMTKDAVRIIANRVSKELNKKLTQHEVSQLIEFITKLPPSKYCGMTLAESYDVLVSGYLNRNYIRKEIQARELPTNVIKLTRLDEETDDPTIDEYQKKEVLQITKNENVNKYSAFADRRGNAVVDSDRTRGNYSSPDSLAPKKISKEMIAEANYEALHMVKKFIDPDSINQLLGRFSNAYTTFLSINLPHQTIPFDSRNRSLTDSTTEYSWVIHTAGNPGHIGDVKFKMVIRNGWFIKVIG